MATERRLIDANVVLARLKTDIVLGECEKAFLRNFVNNAPTVDAVEVVHGEWTRCLDVDDVECIECPLCFGVFYDGDNDTFDKPYNYCPNCGAKMDGDGNVANE